MEKTFSSLSFQSLVLSYVWKNQTSIQFTSLLRKDYFEDPRCAEIYEWIAYFIKTHGPPASKVMMRDILSKPKAIPTSLALFEVILKSKMTLAEESYVTSEVKEFCRYQAVVDVLANKAEGFLSRGNLDDLRTALEESFAVGQYDFSKGLEYFNKTEVSRRIRDRTLYSTRDYFSTYIAQLDHLVKFRRGQIGIVLGNSGRGKTMFLIYIAKVLLMQKLKVVYYTLQLPEDEIASRMDAALSNINMRDLRDSPVAISSGLARFYSAFRTNLFIKAFPTQTLTVNMLRGHLDLLRSTGFSPDVVLLDYGNLMRSDLGRNKNDSSRYSELGEIYESIMAMSQEQNLFTLVAHQTKAASWDKPVITISDAAESSNAVMVSPLVISLNRNLQDEALGQARIHLAKYTYGPDGQLITVGTDFPHGLYYSPWKKVVPLDNKNASAVSAVAPTATLTKGRSYTPKGRK